MTPVTTPPLPGSMEVPPLHGWVHILVPLLLIVVGVVAVLVIAAAGKAAGDRSEWQAWLDGRSARGGDEHQPPAVRGWQPQAAASVSRAETSGHLPGDESPSGSSTR